VNSRIGILDKEALQKEVIMNKFFLIFSMTGLLSSCNMVNETISAMQNNRDAIEMSTQAIQENAQAVEEANRAIQENKRQLDAINETLKKANASA
jgi:methyl-accepting chemotaxis protein